MASKLVIFNSDALHHTIKRLCFELVENHQNFSDTVIIGIQPRGVYLAQRITHELQLMSPDFLFKSGSLDVTFYRDDIRKRENPIMPNATNIDFMVENKKVILIDDVLYTGRTIRSAMDALLAFGRPQKVELLVLIDRRYSRHLPIQPDYTGKVVDTFASDNVKVKWSESDGADQVLMFTENEMS